LEVIGEVYARPEPWVGPQLRPDQSWFWTPQWQAMESEATNDLATGSYEDFDTVDDFIEDLERLMEE
jgi:hypothetical protein